VFPKFLLMGFHDKRESISWVPRWQEDWRALVYFTFQWWFNQGRRYSGRAGGQWKSWGQRKFVKTKKIIVNYICSFQQRCPPENQYQKLEKTFLKFLGARMAAINLFKFDLGEPWNYLRYFHEKVPPPPLSSLWKSRG